MYEAPHIGAVGSVRGLTLDGTDKCYDLYGKTVTQDRDEFGYFTDLPIGDCAVS